MTENYSYFAGSIPMIYTDSDKTKKISPIGLNCDYNHKSSIGPHAAISTNAHPDIYSISDEIVLWMRKMKVEYPPPFTRDDLKLFKCFDIYLRIKNSNSNTILYQTDQRFTINYNELTHEAQCNSYGFQNHPINYTLTFPLT